MSATILYLNTDPDAHIPQMTLAGMRRYAASRGWAASLDEARQDAAPPGAGGAPAEISFRDYTGRVVKPVPTAPGEYLVPISGDPIYFEGGALPPPWKVRRLAAPRLGARASSPRTPQAG